MTIYIKNHDFHYELENLCRIFFPNEKISIIKDQMPDAASSFWALAYLEPSEKHIRLYAAVYQDGQNIEQEACVSGETPDLEKECERELAVLLFTLLTKLTQITPTWGILTGVRPIKLMRRLTSELGETGAKAYFRDKLLVSQNKTELAAITMEAEQKLLSLSRKESYSLYVSIPFCPTRCSYCSFVSQTIERAHKMIPEYVARLCEELEKTAQIAHELNLRLESVYIGGGTPTTLTWEQMELLLRTIRRNFDFSCCREFTVEAGRPDTITPEKLKAMKRYGVDRISINPQTLNDGVLELIGRKHSARQTIDAFKLARKEGFHHINMDLIAGLPGDSLTSFQNTIQGICQLDPESVTIHTLAMKKSSKLTMEGKKLYRDECLEAAQMLDYAGEVLLSRQYAPYYLYRQSKMVGNLENVGWAKPGFESFYNVYVMDETHTILACGAGAVTKLKQPQGDYLERVFNFKYPYEYLSRFQEMLERKNQVRQFYDQFC